MTVCHSCQYGYRQYNHLLSQQTSKWESVAETGTVFLPVVNNTWPIRLRLLTVSATHQNGCGFLPAVNVNMVFQVLGGLFQVLGGQTAGQMTKFGMPNTWQTMFTAGKKNRSRFDVSPKLYIAEAYGSGVVYARGNGPSNWRKIATSYKNNLRAL